MSIREILQENQYDVYCKNLNSSGDINLLGDLTLDSVAITSTTESTSVTTGALTVGGGVGIDGKLYVSDVITSNKSTTITPTFSGPIAGTPISITLKLFNGMVFYNFAGISDVVQSSSAELTCPSSSIPTGYRPSGNRIVFGGCIDGTSNSSCYHQISSDGSISIQNNGDVFGGSGILSLTPLSGIYLL